MGFYPVSILHSLSDFIGKRGDETLPFFIDQPLCLIPVSEGSIYNFNQQAYEQLAEFETISKANLVASPYLHVDETGININGKQCFLPLILIDVSSTCAKKAVNK
jgi:hypothetical protein